MIRAYTIEELKEIISQAKAGDKDSFATIYEQFYTPIFRYLYGRTGDKELSQDLTQDVFVRGFKSVSTFSVTDKSPLAYFYTIARNSLIDYWRRESPELLSGDQLVSLPDLSMKTDNLSLEREKEEIIKIGLSALTPAQREVLTLKYLNELSTREISELLGKSEEAIRQSLVRALRAMNKKLEKYGS
jgi:RNA polymerase sigma-70 factor (ECF subfamily)